MSEGGVGIITREEQDAILAEALELQGEQYDHEDQALVEVARGIAREFEHDFVGTGIGRLIFLSGVVRQWLETESPPRVEYKWKDGDLSNFLHVFWQDELWSELPFDCVYLVMKHCKTNNTYRTYTPYNATDDVIANFRSATAVTVSNHLYDEIVLEDDFSRGYWFTKKRYSDHIDEIPWDFQSLYPTEMIWKNKYAGLPAKVVLKTMVNNANPKKAKKKKKCKHIKNHQGGMKNYKRQPNRAMRRR